jgi:hypothetical protein
MTDHKKKCYDFLTHGETPILCYAYVFFFFGTVKIIRNLSLSTTTPVLLLLKLYTHLKASNLIK